MPDYPLEYLISPAGMPRAFSSGSAPLDAGQWKYLVTRGTGQHVALSSLVSRLAELLSISHESAIFTLSSPDSLPFVLGLLLILR